MSNELIRKASYVSFKMSVKENKFFRSSNKISKRVGVLKLFLNFILNSGVQVQVCYIGKLVSWGLVVQIILSLR